MNQAFGDARPALRVEELRREILRTGSLWTALDVVPEIGSTNTALAVQARTGAPEGAILLAESQLAGRGRLARTWTSPPRAGISMSVLLRPAVPMSRYGWLPLLAGVALADTVTELGRLDCGLKWPNDLLIAGRKCAGILAEIVNGAVVLGMGLNVSLGADELPRQDATSLALENSACLDRELLISALSRSLQQRYRTWCTAAGDPHVSGLIAAYRERCVTLGRRVRVELPDGSFLPGVAVDIDDDGRLLVEDRGARTAVAAGDVLHVR